MSKINALTQWFGGNRNGAHDVARLLGPLAWCGVPFMGGASDLFPINTREGMATDLHGHIINLVRVARDQILRQQLIDELDQTIYHEDELRLAQRRCQQREASIRRTLLGGPDPETQPEANVEWARDYFVCSWMVRGGAMGKEDELAQSLSVRYTSSGGASTTRFRSAVDAVARLGPKLGKWAFVRADGMDLIRRAVDDPTHGLYCDPPWVVEGGCYRHPWTEDEHAALAAALGRFQHARIVVRYADHPLLRELYRLPSWRAHSVASVNQAGKQIDEILFYRNAPLFAGQGGER